MNAFNYQDIYKDALDGGLASAKDMAYFEGDFWPNVMEESIKELDQEEEEKRKREEAEAAEAEAQDTVEETTDAVSLSTRLYRLNQETKWKIFNMCYMTIQ